MQIHHQIVHVVLDSGKESFVPVVNDTYNLRACSLCMSQTTVIPRQQATGA